MATGMVISSVNLSLYLNITNRCTNVCTFCAKRGDFHVKGHYLKLPGEPGVEQLIAEVGDPTDYEYEDSNGIKGLSMLIDRALSIGYGVSIVTSGGEHPEADMDGNKRRHGGNGLFAINPTLYDAIDWILLTDHIDPPKDFPIGKLHAPWSGHWRGLPMRPHEGSCTIGALRPFVVIDPHDNEYGVYTCRTHFCNNSNEPNIDLKLGPVNSIREIWDRMNKNLQVDRSLYGPGNWKSMCEFCSTSSAKPNKIMDEVLSNNTNRNYL